MLYKIFVEVFNAIIENRDYFIKKWRECLDDENVLKKYKARQFIKIFERAQKIEKFDVDLYYKVIEKIVIYQGNKVIVGLLDGSEIEIIIE